jgi:hypothetical protein
MPGRSRAAPGLRYNNTVEFRRSPDKEEKQWGLRTDFVEHKNEALALRFAPTHLFLNQSATAPSWVTRIEHQEDDVGLVDDFVHHADVVSPLLFLRLVGSCRRVERERRDVINRCGLCELG